ncbi:MAG: hypothetical protein QNJ17_11055 [Desulfocapsaceae bacterium]|nr:hypothetical protein [Desulfocapsaceae bacterium]
MVKNIFVAGLDDFHLSQLLALRNSANYRFHSLISSRKIKWQDHFPVEEFLRQAKWQLHHTTNNVDAIIGYWDFPVSTMLPILQKECGLQGPSLEAVLRCEHKYWSRKLQKEIVPENVPPFQPINPFDKHAAEHCRLDFPFWLKPVKSVLSHLGFLIRNRVELEMCLHLIRKSISRYAKPFNFIMQIADLPEDIRTIDGFFCIAEGLISHGRQCTLEGFVTAEEVHIYGCVDSHRSGRNQSCFSCYEYPSTLPADIQLRLEGATRKVIRHVNLDNSPFNIEFYWDETTDHIALLEINTRISKSHGPLFKMVDGEYHLAIPIELGLGNIPSFPVGEGEFNVAGKFMLRSFRDGTVQRIPQKKDVEKVRRHFPGTEISIKVKPGMQLSDLRDQDSYSYELAEIFMGADCHERLMKNYQTALSMLQFDIEPGLSPAHPDILSNQA